ncbi:hypothetical protein AJ80_02317 [Polytolypa hystricis UAMH7299]|uniref:Protein kinase domain-containing protein n=1 Tax=Polytolypa hystricis (strain UAMH7299) TaxID=1447883 RepID=A0A2B7YRM5_POLH7|nr:hypothetical protein AJ80_02317 [Polytolypa hystricis UAMH7299]
MCDWPRYSVECWFDKEKESKLIVRCRGKCFHITLSPRNFHESPDILNKYLHFAEVAEADGDLEGLTIDDFQDWALQPFLPVLRNTEPAWEKSQRVTLYDYLNPDTFYYSLSASNNVLIPVPRYQVSPRKQQGVDLDSYILHSSCPSFHPRQVEICVDRPEDTYFESAKKVLVGKTICFFKQWSAGDKRSALRELESYICIEQLRLGMEVPVPCLFGVVQSEGDSRYQGLLLSWIDCQNMTLECALGPKTPIDLRQKWVDQLTVSLDRLHSAGVIWGDVKAANVLVDRNGDIWMIDFGGGYTRGWVDKEKAGTIDGDKQGLQKIRDMLLQHA